MNEEVDKDEDENNILARPKRTAAILGELKRRFANEESD